MKAQSQIFNIPNILAFIRLLLAPLMFLFLVNQDASFFQGIHPSWLNYFAAFIFVVASATDFFDGYIAKPHPQAYQQLINALPITFEECVLFDDAIPNLVTAKNLGILPVFVNEDGLDSQFDYQMKNIEEVGKIVTYLG